MTRDELENKMSVLLAGRAAELTVFGICRPAPQMICAASPTSRARW